MGLERISICCSLDSYRASWYCFSKNHRKGILHWSCYPTSTNSDLIRPSFMDWRLADHGFWPEYLHISLKFLPVVDCRSLETKLLKTRTSLQTLFLKFLKNLTYPPRMSVLADDFPHERTCWSKKVLVFLGQPKVNLTAISQEVNTRFALNPSRSQSIDP